MRLFRNLFLSLIAAAIALPAMAQFPPEVVHWSAPKAAHVEGDLYRVTFTATIDAGWHTYDLGPYTGGPLAPTFTFKPAAGVELVGKAKQTKAPKRQMDEIWGMEVGYLSGTVSFTQDVRLKGDKATLAGAVETQACNDETCNPPTEFEFSVNIVKAKDATASAVAPAVVEDPAAVEPEPETPETEVADTAAVAPAPVETEAAVAPAPAAEGRSLWGDILQAISWGLLALLTPCVFPMLPVTVSFFLKQSSNKATGRFKASMFGLFIIVLYTLPVALVVIIAQITGGAEGAPRMFNWLATNWLPNTIFFIIFMIFAASFFGAFEITAPSSLVNKSDSKADKGGLVGVFFMALTLVLISFSCTAPIVGMVVVDAATTSTAWWQPIFIMLIYSAVFAIPFVVLAFAPSLMEKMKSGSWMNAVKVSLGFVEVALAFKFLMIIDMTYGLNMLSREMCLAIWIACGLLWGLYLIGAFKTRHDSDLPYVGPVRMFFAIIVFTFTLLLVPGMWGAPLKWLSGYMPPMTSQQFRVVSHEDLQGMSLGSGAEARPRAIALVDGKNPVTGLAPKYSDVERIHAPDGFTAFFDYNEAVEYAKSVNKPVFVDITGAGCVNCRNMEQSVWTDPAVKEMLLYDYVMVCIYLDVKFELPEKDWVTDERGKVLKSLNTVNMNWSMKQFKTVAQPIYAIVDPRDGAPLGPNRAFNLNIGEYASWLKSGLDAYKAK